MASLALCIFSQDVRFGCVVTKFWHNNGAPMKMSVREIKMAKDWIYRF